MKKRLGFTLIEVMVVMTIIAVLATAGISSYAWYVQKAKQAKTDIYLANLVSATIQFKADNNGRLPDLENSPTDIATVKSYLTLNSSPLENTVATLSNIFGISKTFAAILTEFTHPAGDKAICIGKNAQGEIINNITCEIIYYRFSDGKFAFSGGILTKSSMKNFHKVDLDDDNNPTTPARITFGTFVGDSPVIARTEESLSSALSVYNPTVTVKAVGITPVTSYIPAGTTIPVTGETYPPTDSDSSTVTDPETSTIWTSDTDTNTTSWWEETTTEYPTTSWGEMTTDYGTTAEETTTGWWEEATTSGGETNTDYNTTESPTTSGGEMTTDYGTTESPTTSGGETTTEIPATTNSVYYSNGQQCFWKSDCPSGPDGTSPVCTREHFWSWYGTCGYIASAIVDSFAPTSTYYPGEQPYGQSCSGVSEDECRPDEICDFGYLDWFWTPWDWVWSLMGGDTTDHGQCILASPSSTTEYPTTSWGETTTEYSTDTWGETTTETSTTEYPTTSWGETTTEYSTDTWGETTT